MGFIEDIKRVRDRFGSMHPGEQEAYRDVINANPFNAFVLKESAESAENWAKGLASMVAHSAPGTPSAVIYKASLRNGPADAARHCYWSARLASKLSYNEAMRVVFTHEYASIDSGVPRDQAEARMDLHNDRIGLEIGTRMKGAADHQLQDAVLKALWEGRLRTLDVRTLQLVPTKSLVPQV